MKPAIVKPVPAAIPLVLALSAMALLFASCSRGDSSNIPSQNGLPDRGQPNRLYPHVISHVYVLDAQKNMVFRFPFNGSVVAQSPDATLNISGVLGSFAQIAVGSDGSLYVPIQGDNQINVYAFGSSGDAAPIRTISVPRGVYGGLFGVFVDAAGYVYATALTSTPIFAPGANGATTPVQVIPQGGHALDVINGQAYITGGNYIRVYDTPLTNPTLIRTICFSGGLHISNSGITNNSTRLFISQSRPGKGRIATLPLTFNKCPAPLPAAIVASPLPNTFYPQGIARSGSFLFVADSGSNRAAYQLSALGNGARAPISIMSGPFGLAFEVTLGP